MGRFAANTSTSLSADLRECKFLVLPLHVVHVQTLSTIHVKWEAIEQHAQSPSLLTSRKSLRSSRAHPKKTRCSKSRNCDTMPTSTDRKGQVINKEYRYISNSHIAHSIYKKNPHFSHISTLLLPIHTLPSRQYNANILIPIHIQSSHH
jgi:hypothetical protein